VTDLNISGVSTANDLLRRMGAEEVLVLLQRLGFWVAAEGPNPARGATRQFPKDLSKVDTAQLGDESSYWQSELSRVVTIIGALQSRRLVTEFELKRARNTALARILRGYKDREEKAPSQAALNAEVATQPDVQSAEEASLAVEVAVMALSAVKESLEGYTRVLSREISRRGDLLRSGVER